ncbi:MAG: OsmC family protein [Chromatiales bacterium]|nr:OsmC family protein [Chromatiales bacterium]
MGDFPHEYKVSASSGQNGGVTVSAPGLPDIASGPPAQFGGSGDVWSPEDFITAAVADCFVLSFKAVARGSRFDWTFLDCHVSGFLDKVDGALRFTRFDVKAVLTVPEGTDPAKAIKLLEKSEKACLITNSLTSESHLEAEVQFG